MQITIDTPPLDSITDHRAALVALDAQLQPAWPASSSTCDPPPEPAAPEPEPTGPLPWVQPTGTHDAYQIGAGKTWTSTAANNVWAPGVFGWKDIGDTTGS